MDDEDNIPAREACIFWTPGDNVAVARAGGPDLYRHHQKSGGACFLAWKEASLEGLYFRLLQQVAMLTIAHRVPPERVHEAFKVIPEYRAILSPDHPDHLRDDEEYLLDEGLPDFGQGYPRFSGSDDEA